jgi:hypothetical protein
MKKHRQSKKGPYIYAFILIIILGVLFGLAYKNNQYGTLQIKSLDEDLTIFIDDQRKIAEQDINPQFDLKEGKHVIVMARNNFWPWIKEVDIKKQRISTVQPFFIPQNTSGILIGETDPEYSRIISLFQGNLIATSTMDRITEVNYKLKSSITSIDFYKDRQDIVVISSGDGIYALEIGSGIQNFQPIYKGKKPVFKKRDSSSIYVLDDNNLMLINY